VLSYDQKEVIPNWLGQKETGARRYKKKGEQKPAVISKSATTQTRQGQKERFTKKMSLRHVVRSKGEGW